MSQLFTSGGRSIGVLALTSVFPNIRVFSNESVLCITWPKYWSFSFSISPSNEYSGLISFRMDWLDLLAVQGALKSLLQFHSSKASILLHSAFFMIQHSHPYMTTGKTIALTRRTFVDKVMSLLFNMLSRLVITFLSRSKRLLISWLQSPSAVILEPPRIKSATVSPSICHEVVGPDAMILVFWSKLNQYLRHCFSPCNPHILNLSTQTYLLPLKPTGSRWRKGEKIINRVSEWPDTAVLTEFTPIMSPACPDIHQGPFNLCSVT